MSVVQRGDGDGGGGQSNLEQALGVTKDALPIASSIARAGFNIVRVPLLTMFSSSLSRLRLSSANHSAPRCVVLHT